MIENMNLKLLLMNLGNKLVMEHGFDPTTETKPITEFTTYLNNTPKAQQVLEEMGVEWPVVDRGSYEAQTTH